MNYQDITDEQWEQWKRKRQTTLIGYLIVGIMVGIDYSFMFTTLYLYLEEQVHTPNPRLYYGLIIGAYCLSSTLFGVFSGRWVDKTRRIKLYTIAILFLQVIGCLLYVIHLNVAYPLMGRLVGGLGDPFLSVSSGEVVRIYNEKESTRALWWLASVYSFGLLIGPGIVLFVTDVDFYIGTVHVTQLNAIAIIMAGLLLGTIAVAHFLIHDCSAEIDLKEYLKEQQAQPGYQRLEDITVTYIHNVPTNEISPQASSDYQNRVNGSENFVTLPLTTIIRQLLRNPNTILMFISTFVFMYGLFSSELLLPMLTIDVLKWSLTTLTWITIGIAIVYFTVLMVMSKYSTGPHGVYLMSIVSVLFNIILFVSMNAMKLLNRNHTRDVVIMMCFIISQSFGWIIEAVIIRCMLAKMVPSHCQSFTESCRNAVARLGMILASVSAPLVLPFLEWWSSGIVFAVVALLLLFVVRRHHLVVIKEISSLSTEIN